MYLCITWNVKNQKTIACPNAEAENSLIAATMALMGYHLPFQCQKIIYNHPYVVAQMSIT